MRRRPVPLSPITILVGADNSGKSNFLSFARFVKAALGSFNQAVADEGGLDFVLQRPPDTDGNQMRMRIGWASTDGYYESTLESRSGGILQTDEKLISGGKSPWVHDGQFLTIPSSGGVAARTGLDVPFVGLSLLLHSNISTKEWHLPPNCKKVGESVVRATSVEEALFRRLEASVGRALEDGAAISRARRRHRAAPRKASFARFADQVAAWP